MEGAVQVKGDVEPRDLSKTKQEITVSRCCIASVYWYCVLVPIPRVSIRKMQPIPLVFVCK